MREKSSQITKKLVTFLLVLAMIAGSVVTVPTDVQAASKGKITLKKTSMTMYAGESMKVPVKSVTGVSKSKLSYKADKKIVTVSSKGVITAKKKGNVTIIVASKTNGKIKAKLKLTVKAKPAKSTITLAKKSASLTVGKKAVIKVKKVKGLSSKEVTYKSSNKKVATVTKKGVVKAVGKGSATITVTSAVNKKAKAAFQVNVKSASIPVTSITTAPSMTLQTGSGAKIEYSIAPADATDKSVKITSSNPSVVAVIDGGILGVKAGQATVTVAANNGTGKAKIKVTVKDKVVKVTKIDIHISDTGSGQVEYLGYGKEATKRGIDTGKVSNVDTVKIYPSNATDKSIYWVSTNPDVVTVDKDGVIKTKGVGDCYIYACSCDGGAKSGKISIAVENTFTEEEAYQYLRENRGVKQLRMAVTKEMYLEYADSLAKRNMYFDWLTGSQDGFFKQCGMGYLPGKGKVVYELVGYYTDEEDTKLLGKRLWHWMGAGTEQSTYEATGQIGYIDIDDPSRLIYSPLWNAADFK